MLWEEWADVIPTEEINLLDKGRQQEIVQPLIDLGYLSGIPASTMHGHSSQQQLSEAIQYFRADYFALDLLAHAKAPLLAFPHLDLDSLELNLLHQLTSLDGEVKIDSLPVPGTTNLWTRVIHYRLLVLGLFKEEVGSPFGEKAMKALTQLAEWLNVHNATPLLMVNQAGHIPELTAKLLFTGVLRRNVVVFKYQEAGLEKELLEEVREEAEEHDDEATLIKLEKEVEQELEQINTQLFSKEAAEWERLEKRNKNKLRRVEKVERSMKRLLEEEQTILTSSLGIEVVFQKNIAQLKNREGLLKQDLKKLDKQVKQQGQVVKRLKTAEVKKLSAKRKEIQTLQRSLFNKQNISTTLAQLTLVSQDNRLRSIHLTQLKKSGGKKKAIRGLKKDIDKAQKEVKQLQTDIQLLKKIQKLEALITALENQSAVLKNEQHSLNVFKKDKKTIRQTLKKVQKDLTQNTTNLEKAKIARIEKISVRQIELASMKSRMNRLLEKINGLTYRFKAQLKRSLDHQYYDQLRYRVFGSRKTDFLESIVNTPFNKFLIRLIQIRQWMNGYYYGRLDSKPATRTFQSIVEFTEEEKLPKLRLKYVLTKLGEEQNGFWLLNAHYYFDCLVTLDAKSGPQNTRELIRIFEDEVEKNGDIYNNEVTKEAWAEYNKELKEGLKNTKNGIRRFYFGVKSLARSIGRVFGKIIRFIVRGIKSFIRIFKNFIKLLYKEIREGTRNFLDGMAFLFGNRTIETHCSTGRRMVTKYDFDFDSVVLMSDGMPYKTVSQHIETCVAKTKNLHFSLTLCGKIVKWVFTLTTGTLTWPRLALKIAFYFKNLIFEYFRRRKRLKEAAV